MKTTFIWSGIFVAAAAGACSEQLPAREAETTTAAADAGATGPTTNARLHASDVPIDGLSEEDQRLFHEGDAVFDLVFREPDGLGPLYIRSACSACHDGAARGPGLVQKMSVVGADRITPDADQSLLPFGHTVRTQLAAGAKSPILPPSDPRVLVTTRVGPPILGRGYMEAIADAEIERVAAEQAARTDGIHGTIARVTFASAPNPDTRFGTHQAGEANLIGRFGLKARIVSLDDFAADAFQGDMGITSPMRPTELANPDGLTDDAHAGVDVTIKEVNLVADYMRRIAIPVRDAAAMTDQGRALFEKTACSVCHAPSLKTRADYPIAVLAGIDAPVFTDMLLHDMGDALADGMTDGSATSRQWRTTPLIGLRFSKTFLHDGRVTSVEAAIRAHAGEAKASADAFAALPDGDRSALLRYVEAL